MSGGTVSLGKPPSDPVFGWDNEYGSLTKEVHSFEVCKHLVTNEEYLEFVLSGSYMNREFWSEDGWEWRTRVGSEHPKFWVPEGDTFSYRAMFDEIPMPMDWPAEVNAHEAQAYCKWKGEGWRLMSEAEFAILTREEQDPLTSGKYNLHFRFGSCTPVGYCQGETDENSCADLWGNVWDWLSDDFYPLPGFKIHYLYEDFSEIYMDAEHGMLLGGSWATAGAGASRYYRLWFRRYFYQHAGFRLARDGRQ